MTYSRRKSLIAIGLSLLIFQEMGIKIFASETIREDQIISSVREEDIEEKECIQLPFDEEIIFHEMFPGHVVIGSVYLCETYEVMSAPSYESDVVAEVMSGQTVQIIGEEETEDGEIWTNIVFYAADTEQYGYVERMNIACSDEMFLAWEAENIGEIMSPESFGIMTYGLCDDDGETREVYPDIEQFPDSYREALYELKQEHPNWTFVMQNTGLNWNTVLDNELVNGRSLIPNSYPEYMSAGAYGVAWKNANRDILSFYLDPRNGLTESGIFQFEQLTYNASYHVEASIQTFLNNTFMSGTIPDEPERTYANVFWTVGSQLSVSPFHLASRAYQEQGKGTGGLISGNYPGFEGYYNYFNIGASGKNTQEVITSGLTYAKNHDWNSVYRSIYGGAQVIAASYILQGQDTVYLQKFDVDASSKGLYWHQYMQNIVAPTSEAKTVRKQYADAGSLENTFVFKIPVYENMPEKACEKPNGYKLTINLPAEFADSNVSVDGIFKKANSLNGTLTLYLNDGNAKTAVIYRYNDNNAPIGMAVYTLTYDSENQYVATEQTEFQNLLSYHGFSMRITGNTGLRVKMGISTAVREQLTSEEGLNGYHLQSYGTLLMNKTNYETLPMIRGGEKVVEATAYGNSNGVNVDNIFETVDGRYRYTAVLTGIPVSSYKKELVFRSVIVLTKDDTEITIYGPVVSRSMYTLANQLLGTGSYAQDSEAYRFLSQIISDADSLETEE